MNFSKYAKKNFLPKVASRIEPPNCSSILDAFICNPILNSIYIFFYTSNLIRHYVHILIYEEVTNITHIIDYQGIQPINKTDATTLQFPTPQTKQF